LILFDQNVFKTQFLGLGEVKYSVFCMFLCLNRFTLKIWTGLNWFYCGLVC